MPRWLQFLAVFVPIFCLLVIVHIFTRPASPELASGAVDLLLSTGAVPQPHDLPMDYEPLHQGHIDLQTGLYERVDEDLVVHGPSPLVLRRTYRTSDQRSRPFGVGATHDGEWFIIGDRDRFQWVALVLADGGQVKFDRTSPGTSYANAMYEHRSTPSEFLGAQLGWTGNGWAMRLVDGSLHLFEGCYAPKPRPCGLVQSRDEDGHWLRQTRDQDGRLLTMAASGQSITFEYDTDYRIVHASDSTGGDVRYAYDPRGRLALVTNRDGTTRRYTYTDRDEMRTVDEPEIALENTYDADRCIRQVVTRFRSDTDPSSEDFAYRVENGRVVGEDTTRSDGTWTTTEFDADGYSASQVWGRGTSIESRVAFDREAPSNVIKGVTVSCKDRKGRVVDHSRPVPRGDELRTAWDLLQIYCSWHTTQVR